jgi:hypothetical protein
LRHAFPGVNTGPPSSKYGGAIFLMANRCFELGGRIYAIFFTAALVGSGMDQDGA